MIGFQQFQDDLETIRRALYSGQISAAKVDGQRALERVLRFAQTLENLDVHECPEQEPQGAPQFFPPRCGAQCAPPFSSVRCARATGHEGAHQSPDGVEWPHRHALPNKPRGAPSDPWDKYEWHMCCGNKLLFGAPCPDCRLVRHRHD